MTDQVILLHGIAAGSRSLAKLERAVAGAGYRTFSVDYPSRRLPLDRLVEHVHAVVAPFVRSGAGATHIVGYSLGGLLARAYITRYRPSSLGRVVMLAPPNQGSEIADLLVRNRVSRWLFGPAGAQLTTAPDEPRRQLLGEVDFPLGIVAGDRFVDPVTWLLIAGANDGRVSVARTKVDGMLAHTTVHATHDGIVRNRTATAHVIHFLRHGRF